jgi:hypothetical protein
MAISDYTAGKVAAVDRSGVDGAGYDPASGVCSRRTRMGT